MKFLNTGKRTYNLDLLVAITVTEHLGRHAHAIFSLQCYFKEGASQETFTQAQEARERADTLGLAAGMLPLGSNWYRPSCINAVLLLSREEGQDSMVLVKTTAGDFKTEAPGEAAKTVYEVFVTSLQAG